MAVYAVWFDMWPGDNRSKWKDKLADPRAVNFWDEGKIVGKWYAKHIQELEGYHGKVIWDAYFLYGPQAKWDHKPPPIESWGSPVFRKVGRLRKDLVRLLKPASA